MGSPMVKQWLPLDLILRYVNCYQYELSCDVILILYSQLNLALEMAASQIFLDGLSPI
jgi:hypothetical protein